MDNDKVIPIDLELIKAGLCALKSSLENKKRMNKTLDSNSFQQVIDDLNKKIYTVECMQRSETIKGSEVYEINFSNHLKCELNVSNKGIEVEKAMNGYGDMVLLKDIIVTKL